MNIHNRLIMIKIIFVVFLVSIMSCTSSNEPRLIVETRTLHNRFPDIYEYELPDSMILCGETIDLTDQHIREMFEREFTIMVWDRPQVIMWVKRTGRYFPFFEKKLAERGLPDDLKYLAVAESALNTTARSFAGANGIWQIMEPAAKRFGLRVEKGVMDERLSVDLSTSAALTYLKELRGRFDNWMLAMAAYNSGEHVVNQARRIQNNTDYFMLNLPVETERYVFRIAAIKMILSDPGKFGYRIDPESIYKPLEFNTVNVNISGRFYITDVTYVADITYKTFMELNPKILGSTLPQGRYSVNVPSGSRDDFIDALEKLSSSDYRKKNGFDKRYVVVKEGEVLYTISWRTGVSVSTIMRLNNLKNADISPGQRLLIRD